MSLGPGAHAGPRVVLDVDVVLELIDRCVRARPSAPAVVSPAATMSYAELDRRADAVAWRLRRHYGIDRGDVVMIAAEAGAAFTAAMLGVLRSGAAYLPVDLSYPAARRAQICALARARLVLRDGELGTALANEVPAISLADITEPDPPPADWARPALKPSDPAYLIFSSGSTGDPKGIIQTHRCLVNFVSWQVMASGLGRCRRVLQTAPLSFDVSVQEVCYTLASGGTLIVPDVHARRDPRTLIDFMIEQRVEVVDMPQSLIDVIMRLPTNFEAVDTLRHIIDAGETVRVTPALRELLERRPELTLHNHYGPAENHMLAAHHMSSALANLEPRPPVGSLIWNTHLYLLDEQGRPVADGDAGEVHIGGAGLAIGYTDAELTRRAFVPDPFRPGHRLYRTRDRGRWRPDGTLELIGRIDDLIKIRGHAVEPREVERHVRALDGVRDAAAFGSVRPDGALELHAAVVGEPATVSHLRRRLLDVLPEFMVPVRWWFVDVLPTSPNGKLDRRALPGPSARRA